MTPPFAGEARPHVSNSQLTTFELCGEAYRRKYVARESAPPTTPLIRGISVHGAAEENHRQKIRCARRSLGKEESDVEARNLAMGPSR